MNKILNDHFQRLDSAPVSSETIFKQEGDKERYEALLMYSLRKYQAAEYHFRNVGRFVADETGALKQDTGENPLMDSPSVEEATFQSTERVDNYVFELSAFLEALKSALDLLAEVCSWYLRGVDVNYSIQPLIKLARKGNDGPVLGEVHENLSWLEGLREYRHYLVHRLVPSMYGRYEMRRKKKRKAQVRYPVVVPTSTPRFVPDTRQSRREASLQDENALLPGLELSESQVTVKYDDGTEELAEYSVELSASAGYMPIEEFMQFHISHFEDFFEQILKALEKLQFRPISIQK
jgi:hypothetical protein